MRLHLASTLALVLAALGCRSGEASERVIEIGTADHVHISLRPVKTSSPAETPVTPPRSIPSTIATASAVVASSSIPDVPCGGEGKPPCPLQAFMRGTMQRALDAKDFDALGRAFDQVAAMPFASLDGWATFADAGSLAADDGKIGAVIAACEGCHATLQARFRRGSMRGRKIR